MSSVLVTMAVVIISIAVRLLMIIIRLAVKIIMWAIRIIIGKLRPKHRKKKFNGKAIIRRMPEDIGKAGEEELYRKVSAMPGCKGILRNMYLPIKNGRTSEIDMVVINKSGLHVIEFKNYNCNVYVPENTYDNWERSSVNGCNRYEFHSPAAQNAGHVKALCETLTHITGTRGVGRYIDSYVVFGDNSRLHFESGSRDNNIINISELECFEGESKRELPRESQRVLTIVLYNRFCCVSDDIRQKHVENCRKVQENENRAI